MIRQLCLAVALVCLVSSCAGSSDEQVASSGSTESSDAPSGSNSPGSGGDDDSAGDADSEGDDASDSTDPPDDDAAEIIGNPDLDLEELEEIAPDIADALDEIDDIVSIGACESESIGLRMTYVPDGWQCRTLDQPVGGLDGFTLFMDDNVGGIEITIGTPSPLGAPCEALQLCDSAESIDLGSTFDMEVITIGVPIIYGTHREVEADAVVVTFQALSEDDTAFVTMVLDGVERI